MSKNKVAPLKKCTIPRLELQAALLAVQVDEMLRRELDITLGQSYIWVDSDIVLKYIHNETKRFNTFVVNRVSQIRERSNPHQWHHIKGEFNPADVV